MIRLFVALKIPDEVKKRIIEIRNEILPGWGRYKWEREEKLHLTLKFIGEVDDSRVEEISDSLNFIESYSGFHCKLSRFGFFFKRGIAKILWISFSAGDSLFKLVDEININLEKISIPKDERKFKPHLTLLRMKNKEPKNFIKVFEEFIIPEINFIADEVVLIKSELLPDSSKYSEIQKYKLK